ncbi:hypothetical protein NITHO_380003 [Nitrolancea hollandica Lb]|uniref:Uncharacterized protein n=1 Tax=Nitrolancea hollandica Lb TaxID=1129897 RepID=I4EJ35_9BACT|nr:hypothetical protein NITHO_380003 [Nitrolancea hollandica Lb]
MLTVKVNTFRLLRIKVQINLI